MTNRHARLTNQLLLHCNHKPKRCISIPALSPTTNVQHTHTHTHTPVTEMDEEEEKSDTWVERTPENQENKKT